MVETADKIFVVMELVQGGELFEYLLDRGPLPEAAAVHIMRQVRSLHTDTPDPALLTQLAFASTLTSTYDRQPTHPLSPSLSLLDPTGDVGHRVPALPGGGAPGPQGRGPLSLVPQSLAP